MYLYFSHVNTNVFVYFSSEHIFPIDSRICVFPSEHNIRTFSLRIREYSHIFFCEYTNIRIYTSEYTNIRFCICEYKYISIPICEYEYSYSQVGVALGDIRIRIRRLEVLWVIFVFRIREYEYAQLCAVTQKHRGQG